MAGFRSGLRRAWERWKVIAHKIGNFQARLILTVLYAVLVLPFALAVRAFADPLRIRKRPTNWLPEPEGPKDMPWARKQ